MTVLTAAQFAGLQRAVARRSQGQVSLPGAEIERGEAVCLWRDVAAAFGRGEGTMLSRRELTLLRRRARAQSRGHASLSQTQLSRASGLAFWQLAGRLGRLAERRKPSGYARAASVAVMGLAATQLAACTSLFGGNIKGSFACSAPGGTCAPSTVIDDQALSVIQNARPMTPGRSPVGPYMRPPAPARPTTAGIRPAGSGWLSSAGGGMVHRERRVLKVVFPSFVDGGGNLHEPRIVHAVVDDGAWMQLSSGEPSAIDQIEGRAASLASATYTAPPPSSPAEPNPAFALSAGVKPEPPLAAGPPSPEVVAAARAKGAALQSGNAIDAIRAEVQGRLAQTAKARPAPPAPAPATNAAQDAAHQAAPSAAQKPDPAPATPANAPTAFSGTVEE